MSGDDEAVRREILAKAYDDAGRHATAKEIREQSGMTTIVLNAMSAYAAHMRSQPVTEAEKIKASQAMANKMNEMGLRINGRTMASLITIREFLVIAEAALEAARKVEG